VLKEQVNHSKQKICENDKKILQVKTGKDESVGNFCFFFFYEFRKSET